MKLELVEYQKDKKVEHLCEEPFISLRQTIFDALSMEVTLCIVPGVHFAQVIPRRKYNLTIDDDEVCALVMEMLDGMKRKHLAELDRIELTLDVLK